MNLINFNFLNMRISEMQFYQKRPSGKSVWICFKTNFNDI